VCVCVLYVRYDDEPNDNVEEQNDSNFERVYLMCVPHVYIYIYTYI